MTHGCIENGRNGGLRILIAEHIPSFNRGESAIMHGLNKALRNAGLDTAELTLLSHSIEEDRLWYKGIARVLDWGMASRWQARSRLLSMYACAAMYKVSATLTKLLFRGEFWNSFFRADLIVVGHDNRLVGAGNLLWPVAVCSFARVARKPIVIPAASVDRCGKTDRQLRWLLNQADLATLRDPASSEYCSNLHLSNEHIHLTADLAFLMDPASEQEARDIIAELRVPDDSPLIGVTLSRSSSVFQRAFESYGEDRPATESKRVDLHVALVAEALDAVIERVGAQVVFIPHCTGSSASPASDDRIIAARVAQAMRYSDRVFLMEGEYSGPQLKAVLGLTDMVVGERMHSVINAVTMNVPALCISFPGDPRLRMITEMLGLSDNVYDISDLRAKTLADKVLDVWSRRDRVREHLKSRVPLIQEAALRTGELIAELVRTNQESV